MITTFSQRERDKGRQQTHTEFPVKSNIKAPFGGGNIQVPYSVKYQQLEMLAKVLH